MSHWGEGVLKPPLKISLWILHCHSDFVFIRLGLHLLIWTPSATRLDRQSFKQATKLEALQLETEGLRAELVEMKLAAEQAEETIGELDDKLFKAKVELSDVMEKNTSLEITFEGKVEKSNGELKRINEEVDQKNEELKVMKKNKKHNEKEIYNLQVKVGNLEDTTKKIKVEMSEKDRESKNLKKKCKTVEKNKIKMLKTDSKSQASSKSSKAPLSISSTAPDTSSTSLTTTTSSSCVPMRSLPYSSKLSSRKDNIDNSSYSPASQDNPSPVSLAQPDMLNNHLSSLSAQLIPILEQSLSASARSRSPHTPPGTPPSLRSPPGPLSTTLSHYFPQSPEFLSHLQDSNPPTNTSGVCESEINLLSQVYLGPRKR